VSAIHVAHTGLFVAIGQPANPRYRAVRSFAARNGITFLLPEHVYDELTVDDSADPPPIDTAIEEGWAEIAEPIDDTDSFVSSAMDGVRRFIPNADDRPEDEIERTDTALAGVAAQSLDTGSASHADVYTTDVAAGRAVEAVFDREGYADAITYVNVFRLIEELLDRTGDPYAPFAGIGY